MSQADLETIKRSVEDLSHAHTEILGVYLFGSAATNMRHDSSDIDLAFLLDRDDRANTMRLSIEYAAELETRLKVPVHAIIFNDAPPLLRSQVIRKGQLVFARDLRRVNRLAGDAMVEFYDEIVLLERAQQEYLKRNLSGR
jgi:predicted nucleotidyltransferase